MAFIPRLTAPDDFSTYYTERRIPVDSTGTLTGWQYFYSGDYTYTNTGAHTGNCTWYAMGRSAEIANKNLYDEFEGSYDAQNWNTIWIDNPAITSGTIDYKLGDILVYSTSSGTSGHVEIVEEIDGNVLTISYSAYSSSTPQSDYGTFFGTRKRTKMSFGDSASSSDEPDSVYTRNNGNTYYMTNEYLIGVIHNPYAEDTPTPSTEDLEIFIQPVSYSVVMDKDEDFKDFTYSITISGIPDGQVVSGGNTYPDLTRVYNSGWNYTDYIIDGTTYRRATKTQTLRYTREYNYAYNTTKYMYFNLSYSTGTISTTTPMYIDVKAKTNIIAIVGGAKNNKKRRLRYRVIYK